MYTPAQKCTHMYIDIYTHAYTHAHIHVYNAHIYTPMYTHVHTYMHTNTTHLKMAHIGSVHTSIHSTPNFTKVKPLQHLVLVC